MATRFYFPASGMGYPPNLDITVQPSYSGAWTVDPTPAPGRSQMAFFKPNGVSGNYNQQRQGAANPYYEDLQLYVSEPIPAHSFGGGATWNGQFLCTHQAAPVANVMTGACVIRLMSNDCSVTRGTLLTWKPTVIGAVPDASTGTAWSAAADTNRMLPPTLFTGTVTGYNGDRLVFEIGYTLLDATAGHQGRILFNAIGPNDLTSGDQSETNQALAGWIEYSGDIFSSGRYCRTRLTT